MAEAGDCIVAGVSGGADSVCMLHLLVRLQREIPFRLAVVHVNHGLRAEAGEDAVFVEKLCGDLRIPFYLREVDMAGYAAAHRLSGEEAGRLLRYRAFQEVLEEIKSGDRGRIAVAHNADDRAEILRLKGILAEKDVDELVGKALKAGKISKAQEKWAREYALKDKEGFKRFMELAPEVVPMDKLDLKDAPEGKDPDVDMAVLKACGITKEDYEKYGKAEM